MRFVSFSEQLYYDTHELRDKTQTDRRTDKQTDRQTDRQAGA